MSMLLVELPMVVLWLVIARAGDADTSKHAFPSHYSIWVAGSTPSVTALSLSMTWKAEKSEKSEKSGKSGKSGKYGKSENLKI